MAAIWKEIEIEWQGETYTLRPTLESITYFERKNGSSLGQMLYRLNNQDLPASAAVNLIADALTLAGAKNITPEQVYSETAGLGVEIQEIVSTILAACMPEKFWQDDEPVKKKPTATKTRKK